MPLSCSAHFHQRYTHQSDQEEAALVGLNNCSFFTMSPTLLLKHWGHGYQSSYRSGRQNLNSSPGAQVWASCFFCNRYLGPPHPGKGSRSTFETLAIINATLPHKVQKVIKSIFYINKGDKVSHKERFVPSKKLIDDIFLVCWFYWLYQSISYSTKKMSGWTDSWATTENGLYIKEARKLVWQWTHKIKI